MAASYRLPFLDSLRGLAALYVVAFHTMLVPQPPLEAPEWLRPWLLFGGTGVILFFVISGFSLSMTMPRHERTEQPLLSYMLSRFFRIAPLFYAVTLLSALRNYLVWQKIVSIKVLLLNFSFLFNLVPKQQVGLAWASWTIGVEMLFYVLFPFVYRLSLHQRLLVLAGSLAAFAAVLPFRAAEYAYWTFPGHAPMFLFGMVAFDVWMALRGSPRAQTYGALLACLGGAILVACALYPNAAKSIPMRVPIGLGYACLLTGCALRPFAGLVNPLTTFYGAISYSLYLLHASIVYFLAPAFRSLYGAEPKAFAYAISVGLVLVLTTPLAWIFYRVVERPGIEFGHKVFEVLSVGSYTWRGPRDPRASA